MSISVPRILIVDDELPARNRLKDLLEDCRSNFSFELVGEASNGREMLDLVKRSAIDILFLDIRMPVMDGIEAARHLQKLNSPPAIIFTTALEAHALEAFDLNAVDYLLKPIREERLLVALKKALSTRKASTDNLPKMGNNGREHLAITERDRVVLIPIEDIFYMRAELKYVTLKTVQREYLLEESLINLEKEFGNRFLRIHRNCLVARKAIAGFEKVGSSGGESHWVVLLKDLPEKLAVSRRQTHIMKEFQD